MPAFVQGSGSAHHQAHMKNHYEASYAPRDPNSSYYGGFGARSSHDLSAMLPDPYNSQKYPVNSHWKGGNFTHAPSASTFVPDARINDHWEEQIAGRSRDDFYNDQQQQEQHRKKEEKPVGGVSATLDYEMEDMTDFVVEMAAGMYGLLTPGIFTADANLALSIKQGAVAPPQYRKWVLQVLNATRLPSATIILSLSYMAKRVRQLSAEGTFMASERGLYQLLTVSLILGSKFLDDNTFQNKSWAEVSNITTAELNRDEREWLVSFGHRLHYDPNSTDGFAAWENRWQTFKSRSVAPAVLHPLDTNVRRQYQTVQSSYSPAIYNRKEYSPGSAYFNAPYPSSFAPYDSWYGPRPGMDRSPSTAPHSGPHTPEYYGNQPVWTTPDEYSRRAQYGQYANFPSPTTHLGYHSAYSTYPPYSGWNAHGASCQCSNCRHMTQPKFPPIVCG